MLGRCESALRSSHRLGAAFKGRGLVGSPSSSHFSSSADPSFEEKSISGGPVSQHLRQKLKEAFSPPVLEVVCESHMHNVPRGSEKHFKVLLVSDRFEGLPLVKRQQLVYKELKQEMASTIHALSLITLTPAQFSEKFNAPKSPPCLGGSKHDNKS